jgi:hypothetical protein
MNRILKLQRMAPDQTHSPSSALSTGSSTSDCCKKSAQR